MSSFEKNITSRVKAFGRPPSIFVMQYLLSLN